MPLAGGTPERAPAVSGSGDAAGRTDADRADEVIWPLDTLNSYSNAASREDKTNAHTLSLAGLARQYHTSLESGLSEDSLSLMTETFGANSFGDTRGPWQRRLARCMVQDVLSVLLWVATAVAFIAYAVSPDSPLALYGGVVGLVVGVGVGLFHFWDAEKLQASTVGMLASSQPSMVSVMRFGKPGTVQPASLVPGDVVEITAGGKVPADLRVFECTGDCRVNNAALTGEAEPVVVTVEATTDSMVEAGNLLFLGAVLLSGRARGVVFRTGYATLLGRIAGLVASAEHSSLC